MTYRGSSLSNYVNGVAKQPRSFRGACSRIFLLSYHRRVHAATWSSPAFCDLFDRHIPSLREDNYSLRGALASPKKFGQPTCWWRITGTVRKLKHPKRLLIGFSAGQPATNARTQPLSHVVNGSRVSGSIFVSLKRIRKNGGGKDIIVALQANTKKRPELFLTITRTLASQFRWSWLNTRTTSVELSHADESRAEWRTSA